jgi:hypothetical protein
MKKELNQLETLLRDLGNLYNNNMVITASVLVQNMAFHADNWKEEEFQPYLSILRKMKEYDEQAHILQWAYDEAYMIICGHFMYQYESEAKLNALESQTTEC